MPNKAYTLSFGNSKWADSLSPRPSTLTPQVFSWGVFLSALFTPKPIDDIVQSHLLEMIWDGEKIADVNEVNHIDI
ncbi:hypothetical protein CRN51_20095 [Vibrio vulnificus]|nr:hypothetical protein CRN51_20095 [Vibrio vulnificus]